MDTLLTKDFVNVNENFRQLRAARRRRWRLAHLLRGAALEQTHFWRLCPTGYSEVVPDGALERRISKPPDDPRLTAK
jgi:hypothetical protein